MVGMVCPPNAPRWQLDYFGNVTLFEVERQTNWATADTALEPEAILDNRSKGRENIEAL
jgi:hypothetical protein